MEASLVDIRGPQELWWCAQHSTSESGWSSVGLSHVSEMAFSLNLPLRKAEHRHSPGLWCRLSENGELALALKQLLGQWILEQADFGES